MASHDTRQGSADLEIRYPDGRVVLVEVRDGRGDEVLVKDVENQLAMRIRAASGAFVGAASVFGWYVRAKAPWGENTDAVAVSADWQAVGDDLWRALGEATRIGIVGDPDQSRLFDPAETEERASQAS